MNASGSESVSSALKQAEAAAAPISHHAALGLESQLHAPVDIANVRSFFTPKIDLPTASLAGIEHSGTAAMKAAEGAVSPMLQLIMRLPGHLGLFSSFLEAFKNLFFSHDLLNNFNVGDMASSIDLTHATTQATIHTAGLMTHGHGLETLFSNLQTFHNVPTDIMSNAGAAHLHISPLDSLKQSMNVSASVDLKNPQFEGSGAATDASHALGQVPGTGDSLAGPGLTAQAIMPKLSPAERIFSSRSFESANNNYSNPNNILAFNNQAPATSITNSVTNSNLNQIPNTTNSVSPSVESTASKDSANLPGLHAKALSLESLRKAPHEASGHGLTANHEHIATNPHSKIASHSLQPSQLTQPAQSAPSMQRDGTVNTNHVYSIKSGDSLWNIANRELGSGTRWREIYNLNQDKLGVNPSLIHSGTSISLPEASQGHAPAIPSSAAENSLVTHKPSHYTVKPGGNLWHISKNLFGTGEKWTQLYKFNGSTIGANPRMIFSGQKLALGDIGTSSLACRLPTEQLAHHSASASTIAHAQTVIHTPALAHNQPTIVQNETTATHASQPITGDNHPVAANNHNNLPDHFKQNAADNKLARAVLNRPIARGLAVENGHDQLLSGAGGAQAANGINTNHSVTNTVTNKLAASESGKNKSVVSFSLAPNLAQ